MVVVQVGYRLKFPGLLPFPTDPPGHFRAVADCAAALTWTRHEKGLEDLEPVHRMLAILETDAHLEVLAAQGRLVRAADPDGTHRHRPA